MQFRNAIALAALLPDASLASALGRIDSPNMEKGEFTVEYSGNRTFDSHHDKNNLPGHEWAMGYTPTDRWTTEINGVFAKALDQGVTLSNVQWQNNFQFFKQGAHWMDSGMSVIYVRTVQSHVADAVEVKLLLEKEWGAFIHVANIGLAQEVGKDSGGGPDGTFLWSSRYGYSVYFEPGFEIQSDFGQANEHLSFRKQGHYIGPALYGAVCDHMRYEAAYLFGATNASSQSAVRLLLQYQAHF